MIDGQTEPSFCFDIVCALIQLVKNFSTLTLLFVIRFREMNSGPLQSESEILRK